MGSVMNLVKDRQFLDCLNHSQLLGNDTENTNRSVEFCQPFRQWKLSVNGSAHRAVRPDSRYRPEVTMMLGKEKILWPAL